MLLVKDLMVMNPIVVDKDQAISAAIDMMRKHKVSRLPVMDGDKLVGIVTEKDIMVKLSSSGALGLSPSSLRVPSMMTSDPRTISPEADVAEAAKKMMDHNISSLPVVNSSNKLAGIITETRLLRLCLRVNKIYVGQVMTKNPISISPNARLVNARKLLFEKNTSLLPVLDEGKLVGIVTDGLIALVIFGIREKTDMKHIDRQIREITVSSAMRPAPPFCNPDSKVKDAAKLMIEQRLKGLPVLDYENRLVGVVTKTNLTRLISKGMRI